MLKAFVQNQDVADIEVEERYVSYVKQERSDQYTTVWAPWGISYKIQVSYFEWCVNSFLFVINSCSLFWGDDSAARENLREE